MDSIESDVLHSRLLDIMKKFHNFCLENGINYYMLGGTALGAKRHRGFIPWDDDMDIGIPRDDYQKMILLSDRLPDGLEFRFYQNAENSPMHYVKLIDINTTLIEKNYSYYVEGLYIDIFPLDGAFKTGRKEMKRHKRIYRLFRKICWHCSTEKKKGLFRKMYNVYCKLGNLNRMHDRLEKNMTVIPFGKGDHIANFLGCYNEKECIPDKIFGKATLYDFEDTKLFGPENLDAYLTCLYGNYMELPPVEKRIYRHQYLYLDLNKPYRDYIIEKNTNSK